MNTKSLEYLVILSNLLDNVCKMVNMLPYFCIFNNISIKNEKTLTDLKPCLIFIIC